MKEIYAYIGVIGSGKDYASTKKSSELNCKIFDFSDGVRDFTFDFLGWKPGDDKDYTEFKNNLQRLFFNNNGKLMNITVSGRNLLENVGKTLRNFDKDFWAKYCIKKAENEIVNKESDLIFNAVRYINEAMFVCELAIKFDYKVKFIFTNYKSDRYEIRDNESEYFAQGFLDMAGHMDDITELVLNELKFSQTLAIK